jgi:hypothetical protein
MNQPTPDECKRQVLAMNNTFILAMPKCVNAIVSAIDVNPDLWFQGPALKW